MTISLDFGQKDEFKGVSTDCGNFKWMFPSYLGILCCSPANSVDPVAQSASWRWTCGQETHALTLTLVFSRYPQFSLVGWSQMPSMVERGRKKGEVQPQLPQRLVQASVCVINHSGTLRGGTIHFYPSVLIPPSSLPLLLLNVAPLRQRSAVRHDWKEKGGVWDEKDGMPRWKCVTKGHLCPGW